jgi:hypothetical protein
MDTFWAVVSITVVVLMAAVFVWAFLVAPFTVPRHHPHTH